MITRRSFLVTTPAALIFAPPFVQATNLMPLRGIVLPLERSYFGFVDRLYVYSHVSKIRRLQNVGLSLHQVADGLNKYRSTAINGVPWNAQNVISVLKRDEQIKHADAFRSKTIEISSLDILVNVRCPLCPRKQIFDN